MHKNKAAVTLVVGFVLGVTSEASAQLIEGLVYGTILTEYYDRAYVAAPTAPARHVYFSGEQIYVRIGIGNRDDVPRRLDFGHRPFDEALEVTAITAPPGAGDVVLRRVGAGELVGGARVTAADWQGIIDVPPRGQVRVFATVTTRGAMPPGVYEVRIVPRDANNGLTMLSRIVCFELRLPATQAERAEVIRRRMESAETYQQDALAERLADELLELYPASASAHHVKAQVALRRGRPQEATAALETALRLVRTKEDVLFVDNAGPGVVHGAEKGLEAALVAARSGRRP
jgi:hypothetical protein